MYGLIDGMLVLTESFLEMALDSVVNKVLRRIRQISYQILLFVDVVFQILW